MSSQLITAISGFSSSRPRSVKQAAAVLCLITTGALWWYFAAPQSSNLILGLYSTKAFLGLVIVTYFLFWAIYLVLSSESTPGKVARLTLTSFTLLIMVGLLELPVVFGLVDYRNVISPPDGFLVTHLKPWDNPANLLDPELMHIHRPGQRIIGETTGDLVKWLGISTDRRYPVDLKYDRNGFRNDRELERADVVLVGDSFVEGVLVPQYRLVSSELSRQLGVDVANLGQSGYGPQQELAVVRRFASKLQPRVVVWFFFEGNDLLDVPRYEDFIQNREEIIKARDGVANRSFIRNSLFTLAGLTAPRPARDESEARRRSGTFSARNSGSETLYFAYPGEPLSTVQSESLQTAQTCFLQAQSIAAEQGAQLLLVYVPTKFRVYSSFCKFPDDGYGRIWAPNDLPDQMAAWCKERGIHYLDLTPALKHAAARGGLVYFADDGHWNPMGHQVVGTTLSEFLTKNTDLTPEAR